MKAVVFHGVGDIRLDTVKEPSISHGFDAIVPLTASAICGTGLHFVRGTALGMQERTIPGHEAVGVIEEVGEAVPKPVSTRPSSPRTSFHRII